MLIDSLIFSAYGALITVALIVVGLYFTYLKAKWIGWKSLKDPFFEVALGILGIAISTLSIRAWFQAWKVGVILGYDTSWMLSHVAVIPLILFPCVCYTWHVRTITRKKYGEKIWLTAWTLGVITFVASFTFAMYNIEIASYLSDVLHLPEPPVVAQ